MGKSTQTITIVLHKKELVNDVVVECNQIAMPLEQDDKTAYIAGEIKTPEGTEAKPIVARSITEAFGNIRLKCARYLATGRETDENNLEGIAFERNGKVEFDDLVLTLEMPQSFNIGVTETLKSIMHRYTVDYAMWSVLRGVMPERAKLYLELANAEVQDITIVINKRVSPTRRSASWI